MQDVLNPTGSDFPIGAELSPVAARVERPKTEKQRRIEAYNAMTMGAEQKAVAMQRPSLGRIVLYRLSGDDVKIIQRARIGCYRGNDVREGEMCAAVVTRAFLDPDENVNLKVLLDGDDDHWAASCSMGEGPGQWSWPPRV